MSLIVLLVGVLSIISSVTPVVESFPCIGFDSTFGNGVEGPGLIRANFTSTGESVIAGMLALSDGKLLVHGASVETMPETTPYLILRYNNNGTLDTTFGESNSPGMVKRFAVSGATASIVMSIVLQPNSNKFLAAIAYSMSSDQDSFDYVIRRFEVSTGNLDFNFGAAGVLLINAGGRLIPTMMTLVALETHFFFVGVAEGSPTQFLLFGRATFSQMDSTFALNGTGIAKHVVESDKELNIRDAKLDPVDGSILCTGEVRDSITQEFKMVLLKLNGTTGSIVSGFGGVGNGIMLITDIATGVPSGFQIAYRGTATSTFLVVGVTFPASVSKQFLIQYNGNGVVDTTFGTSGVVATAFNDEASQGHALQMLPNGGIATAFLQQLAPEEYAGVAYFTSNGVLQSSLRVVSGGNSRAQSVTAQALPDGRMVFGLTYYVPGSSYTNIIFRNVLMGRLGKCTASPTKNPTRHPTKNPTREPTKNPETKKPTANPTRNPTKAPSLNPTVPTNSPTVGSSTSNPTAKPNQATGSGLDQNTTIIAAVLGSVGGIAVLGAGMFFFRRG